MEDNFATRIRVLLKQRGMTAQRFEKEVGLANGYIHNAEVRGTLPKSDILFRMAEYLGVTPEFLLGNEQKSNARLIPLVGRVAAGVPISAVENVIGQEEISEKLAATGEFFALKIKGDSMSPTICDGDVVVVRQQDTADSGDIVIALVNGDDGVCKTFRRTGTAVMLISINPVYDPMIFTQDEIDTVPVRILGKVIELRRTL